MFAPQTNKKRQKPS